MTRFLGVNQAEHRATPWRWDCCISDRSARLRRNPLKASLCEEVNPSWDQRVGLSSDGTEIVDPGTGDRGIAVSAVKQLRHTSITGETPILRLE